MFGRKSIAPPNTCLAKKKKKRIFFILILSADKARETFFKLSLIVI